jgi:cytochrome c556
MSRVARGNERRVSFTSRSVMRWLTVYAWMLWAGSAGLAQVFFSVDDLDKAMKAVGRNVGLANAAIASKDFDGAKVRIARAREQLSPTVSFWTNEKKADAVKLVRAATAKLDALDRALSANPVDASAVGVAAMELDAACQACHAVYREQDPATKTFRLKRAP